MALAPHLHPKTYWEQRCELLEESVFRMMSILAQTALPPHAAAALRDHSEQWSDLLRLLTDKHQAPPSEGPNVEVRRAERLHGLTD